MVKKISKAGTINNIVNIQSKMDEKNITVSNTEGFFEEKYYFQDFYDDAKLKRFIKSVERMVRTSSQYHKYIGFLNNDMKLNRCAILGNIEKSQADIEMHHYPFTLYDIVYLNVMKRILSDEKFNTFLVATSVLEDHYDNIIGVVPVSKIAHDLAHSGEIFITLHSVFGNLGAFIDKYSMAMPEDMIVKYNQLLEYSDNNQTYSEVDILKVREKL